MSSEAVRLEHTPMMPPGRQITRAQGTGQNPLRGFATIGRLACLRRKAGSTQAGLLSLATRPTQPTTGATEAPVPTEQAFDPTGGMFDCLLIIGCHNHAGEPRNASIASTTRL